MEGLRDIQTEAALDAYVCQIILSRDKFVFLILFCSSQFPELFAAVCVFPSCSLTPPVVFLRHIQPRQDV